MILQDQYQTNSNMTVSAVMKSWFICSSLENIQCIGPPMKKKLHFFWIISLEFTLFIILMGGVKLGVYIYSNVNGSI